MADMNRRRMILLAVGRRLKVNRWSPRQTITPETNMGRHPPVARPPDASRPGSARNGLSHTVGECLPMTDEPPFGACTRTSEQ